MEVDKIELIVEVCRKLAEIMKDPTQGKEMPADQRTKIREEAYEELVGAIDTLGSLAQINEDFYDILNIAKKYNVTQE